MFRPFNLFRNRARKIFGYGVVRPWICICVIFSVVCFIRIYLFSIANRGNLEERYHDSNIAMPRTPSVKSYTVLDVNDLPNFILAILWKSFPVNGDFARGNGRTPRIPHIIHQTHWDTRIPKDEVEYVRSVIKNHPEWNYYFWTDKNARTLIKGKHPSFLTIWDSYDKGIKRGDALRYFVLYEFSGVYIDLDFEVYRSLDAVTGKYSCIIPPEPLEHRLFLHDSPILLNNGIMLCRSKHPFFKHLIESLGTGIKAKKYAVLATGPDFLTKAFYSYIKNVSANGLYKIVPDNHGVTFKEQSASEDIESDIHIASTTYFNDKLDLKQNYRSWFVKRDKSENRAKGCNEIIARGLQERGITKLQNITGVQNGRNYYDYFCEIGPSLSKFDFKCDQVFKAGLLRNTKFTYTAHTWFHSWLNMESVQKMPSVYIGDIVPNVTFY